MKICDICEKKVTSLRAGPFELGTKEICEECDQDLLRRLSVVDRRVVEIGRQMRGEAIKEWQGQRGVKGDAGLKAS
jgi:hypothetical protein